MFFYEDLTLEFTAYELMIQIYLRKTAQKMKFSIKDFLSVNVTKSAVFVGCGHIYWRNT